MAVLITVGNAELVALRDGEHELDRSWHYPSVPEVAWQPYEDLMGAYAVLNFGCFLVKDRDRTVLIDTGWGPERGPPGGARLSAQLLDEFGEVGVSLEDIDTVVFTHLHADHVGWNLIYEGGTVQPRFARARYLIPKKDWAHFSSRDDVHPNVREQVLPLADLGILDCIDNGFEVSESLVARATPGHTPGHTSFLLHSGSEGCFILGDVAHHPVLLNEPDWVQRFDWDPEQAIDTRRKVLDSLESGKILVAAGHFRYPSVGYITRTHGRRVWEPLQEGPSRVAQRR